MSKLNPKLNPALTNPRTHCILCGRRYGPTEETCSGCGFNPIDDGPCEEQQDLAVKDWDANADRD